MTTAVINSPIGPLELVSDGDCLTAIHFEHEITGDQPGLDPVLELASTQLREYFEGARQLFSVRIDPKGTTFQQAVWSRLRDIPFGDTWSYAELAASLGSPTASRAVGAANGRNPIPIIIPCHRVVGSNGKLTGYAGGLDVKHALLRLESPQLAL